MGFARRDGVVVVLNIIKLTPHHSLQLILGNSRIFSRPFALVSHKERKLVTTT